MKQETFDQLQKRIPERIVEHAVRGMLPKGRVSIHFSRILTCSLRPLAMSFEKHECSVSGNLQVATVLLARVMAVLFSVHECVVTTHVCSKIHFTNILAHLPGSL